MLENISNECLKINSDSTIAEEVYCLMEDDKKIFFLQQQYAGTPIDVRNQLHKDFNVSAVLFCVKDITENSDLSAKFLQTFNINISNVDINTNKTNILNFYLKQYQEAHPTAHTTRVLENIIQIKDTQTAVKFLMQKKYNNLLIMTVTTTTGPKMIEKIFDKHSFIDQTSVENFKQHSINTYGLDKYFQSNNSPFESDKKPIIGVSGDTSWVPLGKEKMKQREQMHAATIIQKAWRSWQSKNVAKLNQAKSMRFFYHSTAASTFQKSKLYKPA